MQIEESTIKLVVREEGFKNKAYPDVKGLWTTGVGHLIKPNEEHLKTATLTDQQVHDMLRADMGGCVRAINTYVTVPLKQNQFDALCSLCFNIGEEHFRTSTVVRKLNLNDIQGAADAFLMWNKPAVLEARRKRERELFLQ